MTEIWTQTTGRRAALFRESEKSSLSPAASRQKIDNTFNCRNNNNSEISAI